MVKSHMNLMDTMMDEFHDEQKFKELNEREVAAWLEVYISSVSFFVISWRIFFNMYFGLTFSVSTYSHVSGLWVPQSMLVEGKILTKYWEKL